MKQTLPIYIVCLFFFFLLPLPSKADSYPEVLFENSVLPNSYSNSIVHYQGNSWVKNIKKSLPVSDSVFYTPNSALSLNYISAPDGYWQAEINYSNNYVVPENSLLIFKMYIATSTSVNELPSLQVIYADSTTSETVFLQNYIKGNVSVKKWITVEVPVNIFKEINDAKAVFGLRFTQNGNDGKTHQLFIDQIEFLPKKTPDNKLTGAAVLQSVMAFERHVDIYWRLPLTPSIRYIKIYRSENKKDFIPVAIRPIFATKYTDVVPAAGKAYQYRVAWVDYQYNESPFSNVLEATTKLLKDNELLDMVQHANIRYFVDGSEFNSGMHLLRFGSKDAIVSPKLTGVGLMALISGVEQKVLTREALVSRVQKIVGFLKGAETIHGAFPALLNGRTGKGVFADTARKMVDLRSTSYLIQSLIVTRQYLNHENAVEEGLRKNIDAICNAVEWNFFVKTDSPFLFTNWSAGSEFQDAIPLLGKDALSTYIIALSSTSFNIELDSYHQALTRFYSSNDSSTVVDGGEISFIGRDSTGVSTMVISEPAVKEEKVNTINPSENKVYHGLPLKMAQSEESLSKILAAFLVFDPRNKHDNYANYFNELQNFILIKYRRSLEESALPASFGNDLIVNKNGWVDPSSIIASYPFQPDLALNNLIAVYRKYPSLFWGEYGFRIMDLKKNKNYSDLEGMHHALAAIMIENGKSGLIWDLFARDKEVAKVVNALFEAEGK